MLSYPKCLELKQAGFPQDTFIIYLGEFLVPRNFFISGTIGNEPISCPSFQEMYNWIKPMYIMCERYIKITDDMIYIIDADDEAIVFIRVDNKKEYLKEKIIKGNLDEAMANLILKAHKYNLLKK